jgi:uncharacterized membrane protein YeaQ/YmgE (transglycosylase-associated protein family)
MLSREAVRNQSEERNDRMGILGWIILGLVAGAIARVLHRGEEPSGVLATMFVGVLGALLAGLIASAAGIGSRSRVRSCCSWLTTRSCHARVAAPSPARIGRPADPEDPAAGSVRLRLHRVGGSRPGR